MGVLFDYFSASSDDVAFAVADRSGGPGAPEEGVAGEVGSFDTVSAWGVDPGVMMGTLEELLTGRPYEEIRNDPRSGHALAIRDEGERVVVTVTDNLTQSLAKASLKQLQEVASSWAATEEFGGGADPEDLVAVLTELAGLAARADRDGERLYCWVCV